MGLHNDISKARALAERAHDGQFDKGGQPYILHPERLARVVPKGPCQVVALLHDVIEDGGVPLSHIASEFGKDIAMAVDCLSRRRGETYDDFIDRCAANDMARVVKLADLYDNMDVSRLPQPLTQKDKARLRKYHTAYRRLTEATPPHP